jgi:hypothetical protein
MGTPGDPKPIRFFVSIIYQKSGHIPEVEDKLVALLGDVLSKTEPEPFSQTTYYEREMGTGLLRHFLLFKPLWDRRQLSSVKLMTNDLEANMTGGGRRTINLDPGYLSLEQVVLATTKGYAHRIYLGEGIFGDLTLMYSNGTFGPLPWTYPDYGSIKLISMLNCWREKYKADLRGGSVPGKSPCFK